MTIFRSMLLAVSTLAALSGFAMAGTDIPCDKLSAGIEVFQCKEVRREFKVGLKTDDSVFCAENIPIRLDNGCLVNGLTGVKNEMIGNEKVLAKMLYAVIPAKVTREQTEKFKLQCEPVKQFGGILRGSSIGHAIKGFTAPEMPGKDNEARKQAWEKYLAKDGKRALNFWSVNADLHNVKTESQTCILYNSSTNTKLLEFNVEIQKK